LEEAKVNFKKSNIKLFVGGEGHTADWRHYINNLLTGDPEDLTAIIDTYGISEVGVIGLSTAMTNLIRDLAFKNEKLREDLFGKTDCVPNMFQYNTGQVFLEDLNGEILLTSKSTTPLVRYNLHDRGGVIQFREMEEILKKNGYEYKKLLKKKGLSEDIIWQQPFVYCFGRRDDTVIIGGANVYPEQIAPALFNEKVKDIHSFKLATDYDKEQHQLFYVLLELKGGISYNKKQMEKMKKKYHDLILKHLKEVNFDFADAYRIDQKVSNPNVEIFENGEGPFRDDLNRTKPRLFLKK
jgi:phenylacetate-CoA ligase